MTNTKTTLCTLSLCLLASAPASAFAQTDTTGAGNSLRIATGKQGKGYENCSPISAPSVARRSR